MTLCKICEFFLEVFLVRIIIIAILINNTFERIAIEMMQFICYPATIIRLCVYPETGIQAFTRKNSHPGYCRVSASECELFIRAV